MNRRKLKNQKCDEYSSLFKSIKAFGMKTDCVSVLFFPLPLDAMTCKTALSITLLSLVANAKYDCTTYFVAKESCYTFDEDPWRPESPMCRPWATTKCRLSKVFNHDRCPLIHCVFKVGDFFPQTPLNTFKNALPNRGSTGAITTSTENQSAWTCRTFMTFPSLAAPNARAASNPTPAQAPSAAPAAAPAAAAAAAAIAATGRLATAATEIATSGI